MSAVDEPCQFCAHAAREHAAAGCLRCDCCEFESRLMAWVSRR